ncbi:MAG: hypothetical protein E7499_06970 [Ruminococcus sp.]|nr:hypothetical protein [Ruminococcus sp.]
MIKLITGKKGTGKTKVLIDMINDSVKTTNGCLVCVEKGETIRSSISYKVRWCGVDQFNISGYDAFYGFLAGMLAGNYDIKEVFVDGIIKIGGPDLNELGAMLSKVQALTGDETSVVFTISADNAELPESVTKFID